MSVTPSSGMSMPSRKGQAPRPPRLAINPNATYIPGPNSNMPHTAQTARYGGSTAFTNTSQPYWPPVANPFLNHRASDFVSKGFEGFIDFTKTGMSFGEKFSFGLYNKFSKWSKKWFTHIFLFMVVILYSALGALIFMTIEGSQAERNIDEERMARRSFLNEMQEITSNRELLNLSKEEWNGRLISILREHKDALDTITNNNMTTAEMELKNNPWRFWNSMFYCATVFTTIGYGHISPKTTLGQAITIVYAIFGIPIFLILLADFGKLFTRGIKFLWAYVRRVYYTGTCRQMRKSQQMQDVMKGVNTVYDVAIRRPSQFIRDVDIENLDKNESEAADTLPETPTSPYPETLEIDDDFNLPVSVATVILVCYIIVGAFVYPLWEVKWSYFEAFYFVFISMSTIGFGDYVPDHPIFMMLSTVYLVFGLALTSMFINVVQIKLSDSFRQASAKIGATIGFSMTEEELSKHSQLGTPVPAAGLNNIPEENDLEDKVSNITGSEPVNNADSNAPPPLLPPRQPRIPPDEPKKKKSFF